MSAAHWTTLFSHVSGRLEIRKLCNFCGSSSFWEQIHDVFCSWRLQLYPLSLLLLCNAFFRKYCKQETVKSNPLWGCLMSHAPLKTFWSWFYLLCQLYQAEIMLKCCSRRCPPCSDDMEVNKLDTIFLSARLSSQGQFCSTNVLADDSEVWPWLWHVTCTLETIFLLKKKGVTVCTVTCQENNHLWHKLRAGLPLLPLLPPLPPVRQGEFQWTLSLEYTESWSHYS